MGSAPPTPSSLTWVDERLAASTEAVFVHGDFHPYNQLWDPRELRLLLVADFEASGVAEPEYDFRVIPSFGPGRDLLTSTVDQYVALTGRRISLERVMALHVCTTLGDALWRSEAGLPLLLPRPGGGTPDDYVDELASALRCLASRLESRGTLRTRIGPPDTNADLDTADGIGLASRQLRVSLPGRAISPMRVSRVCPAPPAEQGTGCAPSFARKRRLACQA